MFIPTIVSDLVNVIGYLRLFISGKIVPGFIPSPQDLVVDLGCGDKPFWRADVFVDKKSLADDQRYTASGIQASPQYFVDSDIAHTPFRTKAFDFSYCSHLLEHVPDPRSAILEIMRISKRGYLEMPNGWHELTSPFPTHLWFIFLQGDTLVFIKKSPKWQKLLQKLNGKSESRFNQLYWSGVIKYQIVADSANAKFKPSATFTHLESPSFVQTGHRLITSVLKSLFYQKKQIDLKELLKK